MDVFHALRTAFRSYRKRPATTLVTVAILAVGIAANTTLFRLTDALLLRSLPVKAPDALVLLSAPGPWSGWRRGTDTFSYPAYEDLRDGNDVFEGVLARYRTSLTLERADGVERVSGVLVSGNYFQLLAVGPEHGRVLTPDDDRPGNGRPVAVLSHRYWRERLGGDPDIVGRSVRLNGHPVVVVGVARRGFDGVEVGSAPDVYVPLALKRWMTPTWDHLDNRRSNFLHIIARLRDGISAREAEASVNVLYRRVLERDLEQMPGGDARFAEEYASKPLHLVPGERGLSPLRERYRSALAALHGMLAFLLLVVCASVANLMVARDSDRRRELATHQALGASRAALARRAWTETLLLALASGALGLVLAFWMAKGLVVVLPEGAGPSLLGVEPDLRAGVAAFVLSVLSGLLLGIVPARGTRASLAEMLRDGNRGASRPRGWTGRALVTAQVALSLSLLMGAGLFARSLDNVRRVDVGFEPANVMSFSIDPALSGYSHEEVLTVLPDLSRELERLPGVVSVAVADVETLGSEGWTQTIRVEGYDNAYDENMNVGMNAVSPGYFETLGIPLLAGRGLSVKDRAGAPKVAVVNEAMAQHFFGGASAVGRRLRLGSGDAIDFDVEIVGVVRDGKYRSLKEETLRFAFIPYGQAGRFSDLTFYLRTVGSTMSFEAVRAAVRRVAPSLPVFDAVAMSERLDAAVFLDRAVAGLAVGLGAMTSLLAAIGLYGLMSDSVTRRTHEIGLRMALGAARAQVLRLVMREVSKLLGIGLTLGMAAGLALGRLLAAQLYGIDPRDPTSLLGAAVLASVVAATAAYLPARRASRMDPVRALKWND